MHSAIMTEFSLPVINCDCRHSLSLGSEVESNEVFWHVIRSNLVEVNLEFGNEIEHSLFSGRRLLNTSNCVAAYCLS